MALQLNLYVTDRKQCQGSVKMCLLCLGEFSTPNASNGGEGGVDSYRSFQLMVKR